MKTITVEYTFGAGRTASVSIPADLTYDEKNTLKTVVERVQSNVEHIGATTVKIQFEA